MAQVSRELKTKTGDEINPTFRKTEGSFCVKDQIILPPKNQIVISYSVSSKYKYTFLNNLMKMLKISNKNH